MMRGPGAAQLLERALLAAAGRRARAALPRQPNGTARLFRGCVTIWPAKAKPAPRSIAGWPG